ncbi:MAG: cohesin domain-containing protein [Minisyncoccia bacterium]
MKIKILAVLFPAVVMMGTGFAHAAQIYLDPATGKFPPGVTFGVDVRLDNGSQCVNAAEVDLAYPKNILDAVDVGDGNSIFSLWVKQPTIYEDYGLVSFVGGLPGGYCGRVAGDPSLSNKLATIYFRFPTSTAITSSSIPLTASLAFESTTEAVLNDGLGTLAKLSLGGATYTELLKGEYAPLSALENAIESDTTPPEPFAVRVYRNPMLFDGQLFAVFSTVDKQTGVDHYEVAEVPTKDLGLPESQWNWIRAISPYLIRNQNLDGMIEVRAIDKAGNERLAAYSTQKLPPTPDWRFQLVPYLVIIGLVCFALVRLILHFL